MSGIEIERKYIIEKPSVSDMESMPEYSRSEITQIYLDTLPGITHRIRRREYRGGRVEYTETVKKRIDRISSYEDEREIGEREYNELLPKMAEGVRPLRKVRHTFLYLGQIFEIDIYPEWERTCIMETELSAREDDPPMPDFIKTVRDVTGVKAYSNASMSREFPSEEKI